MRIFETFIWSKVTLPLAELMSLEKVVVRAESSFFDTMTSPKKSSFFEQWIFCFQLGKLCFSLFFFGTENAIKV